MVLGGRRRGALLLAACCGVLLLATQAHGVLRTATCRGAMVTLFDNWNGGGVQNGATPPTFTTAGKAYCLVEIETYHWNNGQGAPPGTLGLSGTTTVPMRAATGSAGAGGAANVNWVASYPTAAGAVVIDGTYSCVDSSPATWSQNAQSTGKGFCRVYGEAAGAGTSPPTAPTPVAGRSVAAAPVSGTAEVREPGSTTFVPLSSAALVMVGAVVDATRGRVQLTSAGPQGTSTGQFYAGEFGLSQAPSGLTNLTLAGGARCAAKAAGSSRPAPRKRSLWGSAHGNFRTTGGYASATVLGTHWL